MKQLRELYTISKSSDWNACLEALENLLPLLPRTLVIEVVVIYIRRFITSFTFDENAVIQVLDGQLESYTKAESISPVLKTIHTALKGYTSKPGVSNFRNSIKKLLGLIETENWGQIENEILTKIFAGILMGLLLNDWGNNNIELWDKWYRRESKSDMFILATSFWPDIRTKQMIQDLWQSVAKNIENKLED